MSVTIVETKIANLPIACQKAGDLLLDNMSELLSNIFLTLIKKDATHLLQFFAMSKNKDRPLSLIYVPNSHIVLIDNIPYPLMPNSFLFYTRDYDNCAMVKQWSEETTLSLHYVPYTSLQIVRAWRDVDYENSYHEVFVIDFN